MAFFALVTGVGGGSVRDLLIGAPVFWVRDPWVAPVCLGVALLAWLTPRRWWEGRLLEWADAAGLAAYAVLGTAKALAFGAAAGSGGADGGDHRLRRRDHPRRARRAALDPDAAGALCHRRRAELGALRAAGPWLALPPSWPGRSPRSPGSRCAARRSGSAWRFPPMAARTPGRLNRSGLRKPRRRRWRCGCGHRDRRCRQSLAAGHPAFDAPAIARLLTASTSRSGRSPRSISLTQRSIAELMPDAFAPFRTAIGSRARVRSASIVAAIVAIVAAWALRSAVIAVAAGACCRCSAALAMAAIPPMIRMPVNHVARIDAVMMAAPAAITRQAPASPPLKHWPAARAQRPTCGTILS